VGDCRGTAQLVSRRTALDLAIATMAILILHVVVAYSGLGVSVVGWAHSQGLWHVQYASLAVSMFMLAAAWYGVFYCHRAYDVRRRNESDGVVGFDLTPELAEREQAVLQYLADVSHGLRTPLTGILGFADLMKNESRGPLGDEKYAEYIEQIHDDSSHLLAIVDDLLTMSQLDGGVAATEVRPTGVDEAIRAAVRTVLPDNGAGGGRIILQVEPDLPLLRVGEHDLRKMLHNLMDNALRFRRRSEDGPATVAARVDHRGELVISVSDTGIGMMGRDIDMALSRFGRVDYSDGDAALGTIVNLRFPADRISAAAVDQSGGKAAAAA